MRYLKKIILLFLVSTITTIFLTKQFFSPMKYAPIPKPRLCGRFPQEHDIFIDNVFWQLLETNRSFFRLFNAYLDTRWKQMDVKVLASGFRTNEEDETVFCQFWFENDVTSPLVIAASQFETFYWKCMCDHVWMFFNIKLLFQTMTIYLI